MASGRISRTAGVVACGLLLVGGQRAARGAEATTAADALDRGRSAYRRGQFSAAIDAWSRAVREGTDPVTRVDALVGTASAWQMLGRPDAAAGALDQAIGLARPLHDRRPLARALDLLGSVCTTDPDLPPGADDPSAPSAAMAGMAMVGLTGRDPGRYFDEAAAVASAAHDPRLSGTIAGDRGNWLARSGQYDAAAASFDRARAAAAVIGDDALMARSATNAAVAALAAAADAAADRDRYQRNDFAPQADRAEGDRQRFTAAAVADNAAGFDVMTRPQSSPLIKFATRPKNNPMGATTTRLSPIPGQLTFCQRA